MIMNSVLRDAAQHPIWQEEAGLLLIDPGHLPLGPVPTKALSFKGIWNEWQADTAPVGATEGTFDGATGAGARLWGGPDLDWNPGSGIRAFRLHLRESGRYRLSLRSRRAASATADGDSCFLRMDGGQWWITRGHGGADWGWAADHARSAQLWEAAFWDLEAGFHQIEISGRANGFVIDRLALAREGVSFEDPGLPVSDMRPR